MGIVLDEASMKELQSRFDSLSFKEQKQAYRTGLVKSAGIVKRQAKRNINAAPFRKNDDMKRKGISHKANVNSADSSFVDLRLNSWLRIFEGGTKAARQTKKSYNRGSIKGYQFFASALATTKEQVFREMESNIFNAIEKKWQKANK